MTVAFLKQKWNQKLKYENFTEMFLKDDDAVINRMAILAAKIAYFNFEWRYVTLVLFTTVQTAAISSFVTNYNKTVALNTGQFKLHYRRHIQQFVIFSDDFSDICNILNMLVTSKYNSNGKIIIICAQDKCDEEQVFKTLMKSVMINVIYLKPSIVYREEPSVYWYRIVRPGKCFSSKPERLDVNINCENNACFKNLFPEKLSNFYGCSLFIATFQQPPFMYLENDTNKISGKDGNLAKLIADVLNASLVIRVPKEHEWGQYKNKNWTGCLGEIFKTRVHFAMCNAPLTSNLYGNFQVSYPYYYMEVVWTAKVPPLVPSWQKILQPFNLPLKFTILSLFLGIILLNMLRKTKFFNNIRRVCNITPPKRNSLFYAWLLFLGLPLEKFSSRKHFKIIILAWIWFSFVIRCAYQVTLVTSLKSITYNYNLRYDSDILKYPFGGMSSIRDYFIEDKDFYENWTSVDMQKAYKLLDEIMEEKTDFVLALNKDTILHHAAEHIGSKRIQVIDNCIVNSPIVLYFRKHSPMTDPIAKIMNAALECGFIQYSYQTNWKRQKHLLNSHYAYNLQPLTLDNFSGCFFLLIIGYGISILYFVLEVVCHKIDKTNQRIDLLVDQE